MIKEKKVPVGISARHVHLSNEDLSTLFGEGYELTVYKPLSQTGQYASQEKVNLVGPRGRIDGVRILGPVRKSTQVEVSLTDGFKLGINPPVRDSGDLKDTEPITIEGPKGKITLEAGAICAQRHIHLSPEDAEALDVSDKQIVKVKTNGDRALVFDNVLCRIREDFVTEMHIDTDEANAAHLSNGAKVDVVID